MLSVGRKPISAGLEPDGHVPMVFYPERNIIGTGTPSGDGVTGGPFEMEIGKEELMPWSHDDCRDCGEYAGELFMLRPKLWKSLGLMPTDCICLACLSKRLGRPFTVSDFTKRPFCNGAIRGVLAANEALAARTAAVRSPRKANRADRV